MLKKLYQILILPYTLLLLYFMFVGFGRTPYDYNIVRLTPLVSTLEFVQKSVLWQNVVINIFGNIIMFIPFGFLGWCYPKYQNLRILSLDFIVAITIVESMQYFTRLGVFDIDDILLNTFGVLLGYWIYKTKIDFSTS
ncbi:VanZ family protein [Riemerella anatipestifer]|uniref:VanZ family protein n=1 Tax=Riemerella anatipestifer TaxID=34085 RepID=UPI001373581F|nr:VanZ family protein [Riemerella anatipestifer]MBT0548759.1 VanZ family protein [Riemerella anatipestifer]MBT0555072.1 VanZ family protein [Riemerella anatipestifer]MBT0559522.1 VanZ family protein [Riemerella anatipestifer]MDD1524730.1 VanZ family protein [Riemerella anatipestifer]MDD1548290.1 VanZ family protein [Riemerella anatipestifer]